MCRVLKAVLFVGICSKLTSSALAQSTPTPPQNDPSTLHTTTTLVVVPTLVETPAKEVVYSLDAHDFLLTDNGIPQKIALDSTSNQPLSLVVLMQTGGSAIHQFRQYHNLEIMLASLLGEPPNQVSIVTFDSKPEAASPFSSDIAQWTDAIDQPDPGDGGAAILDSLNFALDLLSKQPATNRRAILLISEPTDTGSKTTFKEILRTAGETNTAIYSLTFSPQKTEFKDAFKEPAHLNPPINVGGVTTQGYFNIAAPLGMIFGAMRKNLAAEMATLSGGEAATFDNQHELDDALGTLASHIHNSYLVTFHPTSATPGPHTLDVHLTNHPDLIVSARTSYWSTDPTEASTR
jgi:VWFA-related protein